MTVAQFWTVWACGAGIFSPDPVTMETRYIGHGEAFHPNSSELVLDKSLVFWLCQMFTSCESGVITTCLLAGNRVLVGGKWLTYLLLCFNKFYLLLIAIIVCSQVYKTYSVCLLYRLYRGVHRKTQSWFVLCFCCLSGPQQFLFTPWELMSVYFHPNNDNINAAGMLF